MDASLEGKEGEDEVRAVKVNYLNWVRVEKEKREEMCGVSRPAKAGGWGGAKRRWPRRDHSIRHTAATTAATSPAAWTVTVTAAVAAGGSSNACTTHIQPRVSFSLPTHGRRGGSPRRAAHPYMARRHNVFRSTPPPPPLLPLVVFRALAHRIPQRALPCPRRPACSDVSTATGARQPPRFMTG